MREESEDMRGEVCSCEREEPTETPGARAERARANVSPVWRNTVGDDAGQVSRS